MQQQGGKYGLWMGWADALRMAPTMPPPQQ